MIIGSKVIHIKEVTSSNSYASLLLEQESVPEGTVISAEYQTGGRGQAGSSWESEKNKNLIISIILYPSVLSPSDQFFISMIISLGICDFLNKYIRDVKIKWPNDIYVNDDKIAGILIENSIIGNEIEHSVTGIGLNINQKKFLSGAPNPVSLAIVTEMEYDLNDCRKNLLADLDSRYKQLLSGSRESIRNDYISRLYRYNEWHDFRSAGEIIHGRIVSINSYGQLQMKDCSGVKKSFSFKELEYII
jgi:BirA family biotin operon repressor/biotin-[acetyl-CoA-carboxylase] ligase